MEALAVAPLITIESLRRAQLRRSYAATFLPPLPRTKFRVNVWATKSPRKWYVFKGLLTGCGEAQPPTPTFDDGGHLRRHWRLLLWENRLPRSRLRLCFVQIVDHLVLCLDRVGCQFARRAFRGRSSRRGPAPSSAKRSSGLRRGQTSRERQPQPIQSSNPSRSEGVTRLGEVRGLSESRLYRAEDGSRAMIVAGFDSVEAHREFLNSAA